MERQKNYEKEIEKIRVEAARCIRRIDESARRESNEIRNEWLKSQYRVPFSVISRGSLPHYIGPSTNPLKPLILDELYTIDSYEQNCGRSCRQTDSTMSIEGYVIHAKKEGLWWIIDEVIKWYGNRAPEGAVRVFEFIPDRRDTAWKNNRYNAYLLKPRKKK